MFDETITTDIEETTGTFPYSIHKCWFWMGWKLNKNSVLCNKYKEIFSQPAIIGHSSARQKYQKMEELDCIKHSINIHSIYKYT